MKTIRINDLHDSRLDMYTACNEVQLKHYFEPEGGVFIAETALVAGRAIAAGLKPISFLVEESAYGSDEMDELLNEADKAYSCLSPAERLGIRAPHAEPAELEIYVSPLDVIKELTGYNLTRGVLCAMHRPELPQPCELLKEAHRICVLEDVMNPTNVGAIFRSGAALGVEAFLLTPDCSDPFYRRASRVAMGTVFSLPFAFFDKKDDYMGMLKSAGFTTVSMALKDDAVPLSSPLLKGHDRLAVILGNESCGIREETIAASDLTAIIPMKNGVDSLNVAAASAVTFWELLG